MHAYFEPHFFFKSTINFEKLINVQFSSNFQLATDSCLFIISYVLYKPQSEAYYLTILVLFKSLILSVILEILWLPTNLIICVVVVNLESTLIADNFRLCKNKTKYSHMYIHIYTCTKTRMKVLTNRNWPLMYHFWRKNII